MKRFAFLIIAICALGVFNLTNAQEVKINSNFTVETDGTLVVDGAATTYDDLRVTLDKGKDGAKLTALSNGIEIWHFLNNSVDVMSFTVQLPHTWKEGSRIFPHIHWVPTSTAAGNVEWKFEYSWANYDVTTPQVFPSTTPITSVESTGSTNLAHIITSFPEDGTGIDGTGKKISSILLCKITRDATSSNSNDTYAGDAGALYFDIHIEVNTMGSRSDFTK